MSVNEYADKVVMDFIRNITDHVFLNIQQNKELMLEYQTNVDRYQLDTVNKAIGKKVKTLLNLENDGTNDQPQSWLIKEYTFHKPQE
jgi:hypothetical protein